jgi:hypothetical protein
MNCGAIPSTDQFKKIPEGFTSGMFICNYFQTSFYYGRTASELLSNVVVYAVL